MYGHERCHLSAGCAVSHAAQWRAIECNSMDCAMYEARVTALAKVSCMESLAAAFEEQVALAERAPGVSIPMWHEDRW